MLLEAIFNNLYGVYNTVNEIGEMWLEYATALEILAKVLLDVHENTPQKPLAITVWFPKEKGKVLFRFRYRDKIKDYDLTYEELYQYFTAVLGKEK